MESKTLLILETWFSLRYWSSRRFNVPTVMMIIGLRQSLYQNKHKRKITECHCSTKVRVAIGKKKPKKKYLAKLILSYWNNFSRSTINRAACKCQLSQIPSMFLYQKRRIFINDFARTSAMDNQFLTYVFL